MTNSRASGKMQTFNTQLTSDFTTTSTTTTPLTGLTGTVPDNIGKGMVHLHVTISNSSIDQYGTFIIEDNAVVKTSIRVIASHTNANFESGACSQSWPFECNGQIIHVECLTAAGTLKVRGTNSSVNSSFSGISN